MMHESTESDAALAARLAALYERIAAAAARAGRSAADVTLMAVTKNVPAERIRAAYALGLRDFGENRLQEAERKRPELVALEDAHWELIGHLQTNKVKEAVLLFERVQSVDSLRLLERLEGRAAAARRTFPILLEVNAGEEASKLGFAPESVQEAGVAMERFPHLRAQGLMTVAPIGPEEVVRPVFRRLRAIRDMLRETAPQGSGGWDVLSMGMSDDYEIAIEEGATLVRIGRGLFGPRPPRDTEKSDGKE
jgi:pyridoxal phosphate enzyme (YggS family)